MIAGLWWWLRPWGERVFRASCEEVNLYEGAPPDPLFGVSGPHRRVIISCEDKQLNLLSFTSILPHVSSSSSFPQADVTPPREPPLTLDRIIAHKSVSFLLFNSSSKIRFCPFSSRIHLITAFLSEPNRESVAFNILLSLWASGTGLHWGPNRTITGFLQAWIRSSPSQTHPISFCTCILNSDPEASGSKPAPSDGSCQGRHQGLRTRGLSPHMSERSAHEQMFLSHTDTQFTLWAHMLLCCIFFMI